jgi:uncharacterized protein (DUF1697 family)
VRSLAELRAVGSAAPFSDRAIAKTQGRIQVTFMRSPPGQETIREALALVPDEDRVVFTGREWFWLPLRGISDSQLPVGAIENLVGPMTMRTLGTVSRVLAKFG